MAGVSQGPTPWWQLPEYEGKLGNLQQQAPPGYQYDQVAMKYVPIVGSATDQVAQRTRAQGIQDKGNAEQEGLFSQLSSALNGLSGTSSGGGTARGSVGPAQTPPPIQSPLGASFPGAITSIGGSSAPAAAPPTVSGKSNVAPLTLPGHVSAGSGPSADQLKASNDATFAQTKDTAANTMQAAMRGLTGELAARGMSGGGYEAGRIGQNVMEGANTIGQADRQHAQQQYDAAQALQAEELQADITQRGQDLGAMTTGRGQDISSEQAANAGLISQRGQDISSANTTRGQDLSAAEANMQGQLAQRGQDIGVSTANASNATTQRGQDIQSQIAQDNIAAQKQQALLNLALSGLSKVTPQLSY